MGMGLLRWLLWPRRPKDDEDDRPSRRSRGRPRPRAHHPGVYRIEVDNEVGRFHGDGAPFSFWSSSRVILILSFLLWWILHAGYMIAWYGGCRRAGSPTKAVIAALMPSSSLYIATGTYRRRRRDRRDHFDSYRKLTAEPDEVRGRRSVRSHRRQSDDDEEDDEGEEFVATRTHRISHAREEEESPRVHRRSAHAREESKDDEEEGPAEAPPRHAPVRSQAEERAIQRFVERALRNYDHAKL